MKVIVKAANDVLLADFDTDDIIINKNVDVYQDEDKFIVKLKHYIDNGNIKYEG